MVDTCVCCGRIVPEGRMVCPICENSVKDQDEGYGYPLGGALKDQGYAAGSEDDSEY